MLRHVIAPTRDFTQISNEQIWNDDLSDTAFRLLVRALALPPAKARATTVTELAAGVDGGRITVDRARKQLMRAGLLHSTRWRCRNGQVRTESMISNVPVDEGDAERMFAAHFDREDERRDGPGAGRRGGGPPTVPSDGIALPTGETLTEENTSPLPVPAEAREVTRGTEAEAERVLLSLRLSDPRLVLGRGEVRRLLPLAAEWLARGVSSASLRHGISDGLPEPLRSPYGVLRHRLIEKLPELPAVVELVGCAGCERPFRPVSGEGRCGDCRSSTAQTPSDSEGPARVGWRERVGWTPATAQ
ncbi:hypothetical protein [Kitasatospora kifunensis]|uniref:DNA-binding protein n=1 Tax=Kitasatospora kifunensis TaxID=58351 RepID=A0A7W7R5P4_KITKI|nr:hypothetical protein [Kitasatospora kifunensis]MBB4925897.1 hypothetical protein [Kitasatospora kifunensis]